MKSRTAFVDANMFVRYLVGDHEEHSPIAAFLFFALEAADLHAETSQTVIFEAVHVMATVYNIPRAVVASRMVRVIQFEGLYVAERAALVGAFDLWPRFPRLSYPDAFHLMLASQSNHKTILSFDRGLDRCLPDVVRVETIP